ncbi:uncharacterized protein LOC129587088 [Paramacrobiotus metropolitanus]|uniref:uncharacterized protein LOC129587088 n=1 Tax=Paramacrobiotus metropolitanus TaxID=2943436 RepID=UPI0024464198|nr:uncharacterized protein LOC129587088 [Paramacrobiotus metropolitanus]
MSVSVIPLCLQAAVFAMVCAIKPLQNALLSRRIPDIYLNTFVNGEDKMNHIQAFWNIFDVPDTDSLITGNTFEFLHNSGNSYDYCVALRGISHERNVFKQCIPFKLNEKVTVNIDGKTLQVMFNLVNNTIHAAIRRHSNCSATETTILFNPHAEGLEVNFNGQTKSLYRASLKWYMLGAFQVDLANSILDKSDSVNRSLNGTLPLISSQFSIDLSQKWYHEPHEYAAIYGQGSAGFTYFECALHPNGSVYESMRRNFSSALKQSTPFSTVLQWDTSLPITSYEYTTKFEWNTVTENMTTNNDSIILTYRRTVPWSYHGTYEEIRTFTNMSVTPFEDFTFFETDMINSSNCNVTKKKLRIFQDSNGGRDVILEDHGCRTTSYRIRINEVVEQHLTSTARYRLLAAAEMGTGGDLVIRLTVYNRHKNGSDGALKRNTTIDLSWNYSTDSLPRLDVVYTDELLMFGLPYNNQWTTQFQRIISPLVLRNFTYRSNDSQPARYTSLAIQQVSEYQFRLSVATRFGPNSLTFTFNRPDKLSQPYSDTETIVEYVEIYGKIMLTASHFPQINENDPLSGYKIEKAEVMIIKNEGVDMYRCQRTCEFSGFLAAD